ncbi:GNAT family N-acetyltransferase [Acinetobacter sp. ANC 4178]|uniref:GNAT family N-acetyltransferase n=1 Tax=Acinetobacter sp. ANC 4178 TaxID=2529839 RepID=UPI00103FF177|nr:GNAT family N-acetyltransferase [Acinetobacter sp. ANC 4178]TCB67174.1 GNAT family N-acetyltransferase [Acinetobacter sp. ANC 4178]
MTLQIRAGTWAELQSDAKPIREQVFIQEQQIAAADEWDAQDEISQHFVVCDGEQAIATARLLPNHSIGRVAVLASHRGQGIGKLLMQEIIQQAWIQQRPLLQLSSQVHAMSFYQNLGFQAHGDAYMDCGIPHIDMQMSLLVQD